MNPTILGVIGPGFLNQVPTLPTTFEDPGRIYVLTISMFRSSSTASLIPKAAHPKPIHAEPQFCISQTKR